MVIYDLVCSNHHGFEGWFKNSEDYEMQQEAELVRCPACDSCTVKRKPSTLKIAGKKSNMMDSVEKVEIKEEIDVEQTASSIHFTSTAEQAEVIRSFVEKHFEDVGEELTNEARKMHYGEVEHRGIRGQATPEEVSDLAEEGIDLYSIPIGVKSKKELN